jgi:hypothetical protein
MGDCLDRTAIVAHGGDHAVQPCQVRAGDLDQQVDVTDHMRGRDDRRLGPQEPVESGEPAAGHADQHHRLPGVRGRG